MQGKLCGLLEIPKNQESFSSSKLSSVTVFEMLIYVILANYILTSMKINTYTYIACLGFLITN